MMHAFVSKNNVKRWSFGASVFMMAVCLSAPVWAADANARLDRMERDIQTLNQAIYKNQLPPDGLTMGVGSVTAEAQAQTDSRMSALEQDLRTLTGRVEEQGNLMNQINKALADIQARLMGLEQRGGVAVAPASVPGLPQPIAPAPYDPNIPVSNQPAPLIGQPAPLPPGSNAPAPQNSPTVKPLGAMTNTPAGVPVTPASDPTAAYENAMELLKQKDYALAEQSFSAFLVANSTGSLAPNAKYWLGETYFAQGKYDQAARTFAEGYQKYPKGTKAPDNLLKLGLSLDALKKTADACVAFTQIGKDFPSDTAAANVRTRATAEIKRLKCGA